VHVYLGLVVPGTDTLVAQSIPPPSTSPLIRFSPSFEKSGRSQTGYLRCWAMDPELMCLSVVFDASCSALHAGVHFL